MNSNCTQTFDWLIYRDATLAGLAGLLPVPYVDDAVESRFRTQMVHSIAARRGYPLSDARAEQINTEPSSALQRLAQTLLWPLRLPQRMVMRTWRKAVYVLTVRRTVVRLTHYWRRAFLIDYMICSGYLEDDETADAAIAAMRAVLEEEHPDSLTELSVAALRTIPDVPKAVKTGVRALRRNETANLGQSIQQFMADNWDRYARYFDHLGSQYDARINQQLAMHRTGDTARADAAGGAPASEMNGQKQVVA